MSQVKFSGIGISGVVSVVPSVEKRLIDEVGEWGGDTEKIARIGQTLGLDRRRVAAPGVTTLDLCLAGARLLLSKDSGQNNPVDTVLFVTQTPDYNQPCNAALLHGRLGLPKTVAALDVNLGCSGYVYGLWLAFSLVSAGAAQRVLLLAGDTVSRLCHPQDRAVAPLFGDGGSATLVEKRASCGESWFTLGTDGSGYRGLIVPAGGAREPVTGPLEVLQDADGNWRTAANLCMNGAEVFNFSIKEEPASVTSLLAFAQCTVADVDGFVFHQANRYILSNIARRLKIPMEKVPTEVISLYGNQSSASIPVALVHSYGESLCGDGGLKKLVLSGFGVGLSWASALLNMGEMDLCRSIEL